MSLTKVTALRGFRALVDNVFRDVVKGETVSLPDMLARAVISSNKAVLYQEQAKPANAVFDKESEVTARQKRGGPHAS